MVVYSSKGRPPPPLLLPSPSPGPHRRAARMHARMFLCIFSRRAAPEIVTTPPACTSGTAAQQFGGRRTPPTPATRAADRQHQASGADDHKTTRDQSNRSRLGGQSPERSGAKRSEAFGAS